MESNERAWLKDVLMDYIGLFDATDEEFAGLFEEIKKDIRSNRE